MEEDSLCKLYDEDDQTQCENECKDKNDNKHTEQIFCNYDCENLHQKKRRISRVTTRNIAFTALFTALVYAATLIAIPNGVGGVINFGDAIVLVCATVMNPFSAIIAGSFGACLADITLPGCIVWAPYTLVIKAIMACVCGFIIKAIKKYSPSGAKPRKSLWITFSFLSFVLAELIMALGYFGASYIVSKYSMAVALTQLVSNFIQMAIAVVVASFLIFIVRLDLIFNRIYNRK